MLRLAVFASGHGSNLEAIYQSIASGTLHGVELALVISNNSASGALKFAGKNNISGVHLSLLTFGNDEKKLESKMLEVLGKEKSFAESDISVAFTVEFVARMFFSFYGNQRHIEKQTVG